MPSDISSQSEATRQEDSQWQDDSNMTEQEPLKTEDTPPLEETVQEILSIEEDHSSQVTSEMIPSTQEEHSIVSVQEDDIAELEGSTEASIQPEKSTVSVEAPIDSVEPEITVEIEMDEENSEQGYRDIAQDYSVSISPADLARRGALRILIDPGHGGLDGGAVAQGTTEKELNGFISYWLGYYLKDWGFDVHYTRDPQNPSITLALDQRISMINDIKPHVVLSIHHNASFNSRPNGYSLYWSSYRPWMDQQDVIVERNGQNYPWEGERIRDNVTYVYYRQGQEILEVTGDNAYKVKDQTPSTPAQASFHLAMALNEEMALLDHVVPQRMSGYEVPVVDMENRVLRLNRCTAVLVECGFMTNPQELQQLRLEENQRLTALAIAHGLRKFLEE